MTQTAFNSWQAVRDEMLRRLQARVWRPGDMIPNEADIAQELGCARATVNRALRALSDTGLLERRRKAGTRVALHPVRRAMLEIPMIRKQVEDAGYSYAHRLMLSRKCAVPAEVGAQMLTTDAAMHLKAIHFQDDRPFIAEERWINLTTVPDAVEQDFSQISANEWLLGHAPFSHGDITFCAEAATADTAEMLQTEPGAAIFVTERCTWAQARSVTFVRMSFAPGYRMQTQI